MNKFLSYAQPVQAPPVRFTGKLIPGCRTVVFIRPSQFLRLVNTAPAEMVEHLVGQPKKQAVIRLADKVQHGLPITPPGFQRIPIVPAPFLKDMLHLLVRKKMADPVSDGFDQFFFFFEERTYVRRRHFPTVEDRDRSNNLVLL